MAHGLCRNNIGIGSERLVGVEEFLDIGSENLELAERPLHLDRHGNVGKPFVAVRSKVSGGLAGEGIA